MAKSSRPGVVAKVEITGLKRTVRELREMDAELGAEIKLLGKEAAELVAADARVRAPKLTGRLAKSIRVGATFTGASVSAGGKAVPYAAPIHWGWPIHGIAPQPFMYEALDAKRAAVLAAYDKGISALVERAIKNSGAD